MGLERWENIIVEWVNCLKISTTVSNLDDLKDGLFLSNLCQLLTTFESPASTIYLSSIIYFLNKQYPNLILDCENDTDLEKISQNDLMMISSLLLHFSCIHDRRDVLTSPLCYQLSKATQISIKYYLENVHSDINKEKLFKIIEESINIRQFKSNPRTLSSEYSFHGSPLQQLLHTPLPKLSRLREKDKEINKLQVEVDLERLEKFDLQDELAIQKECNKKLSQQVSIKAAEISKLRNELMELENKSLSDSSNLDWKELQQRYRSDINNLELYISQLQSEQELLHNERDEMLKKVTKLEAQCLEWQKRAILSENNYDQILEKHERQEDELKDLHTHCSELSDLLEELRTSKEPNESCVELDTSSTDSDRNTRENCIENLACYVIEVQLKDALTENVDLKNSLQQTQNDISKLRGQMEEITVNYQQVNTEKEELLKKVDLLHETKSKLQEIQSQLSSNSSKLEEVLKVNTSLKTAIESKDHEIEQVNEALQSLSKEYSTQNENIRLLRADYDRLQIILQEKENKCSVIEKHNITLNNELDSLRIDYNKAIGELKVQKDLLSETKETVDCNLRKLHEFVFGVSILHVDSYEATFTSLLKHLQTEHESQKSNLEIYTSALEHLEQLVAEQKTEISCLSEQNITNQKESEIVSDKLLQAEKQIFNYKNEILQNSDKIAQLEFTIDEMSASVGELEVLKTEMSQLQSTYDNVMLMLQENRSELERYKAIIQELSTSLSLTEQSKADFQSQVVQMELTLQSNIQNEMQLRKELSSLHDQLHDKSNELEMYIFKEGNLLKDVDILKQNLNEVDGMIFDERAKKEKYIEQVTTLEASVEHYQTYIKSVEAELANVKTNYLTSEKELQNALCCKQSIERDFELTKINLAHYISTLDEAKVALDWKLKQAQNAEALLTEQLLQKTERCDSLIEEVKICTEGYMKLEVQYESVLQKLELQEKESERLHNSLAKSNEQLAYYQRQHKEGEERIAVLGTQVDDRDAQVNEYKSQIAKLEIDGEHFREKVKELQEDCCNLQNGKIFLEGKCRELESKVDSLTYDLSDKSKELDKNKQNEEKMKAQLICLGEELLKQSMDLENLTEQYDTKVIQLRFLEEEALALKSDVQLLVDKENFYVEELASVREELSLMTFKYTESLQTHHECVQENNAQINSLTENLHEIVEKYNILDKCNSETNHTLSHVQEQLREAKHSLMERTLLEDEYKKRISDLNSTIGQQILIESALKSKLEDSLNRLSYSESKNETSFNNFKGLCVLFAQVNVNKINLSNKLGKMMKQSLHLKESFDILKADYIKMWDVVTQNLKLLEMQLLWSLKSVSSENENLKTVISQLETERLNSHVESLALIDSLKKGIEAEQGKLADNTKALDDQAKVVEDYQYRIKELSANETAYRNEIQHMFQSLKDVIENVNDCKNQCGEDGIQVDTNSNVGNISTANRTLLSSISEICTHMKEVISKEKENFKNHLEQQKLSEAETASKINHLHKENDLLQQEIRIAKQEIENHKEKIKTVFVERQALELEVKVANEKIFGQESIVRSQENVISDANFKLVDKLEEILQLEKAKQTLQLQVDQLTAQLNDNNVKPEVIEHSNVQGIQSNVLKQIETLRQYSMTHKTAVDKLITERNFLESVINNVKHSLFTLQTKTSNLNDDREAAKLRDQIESFEFIVEDLQKQFARISKKIHEIVLNVVQIPAQFCNTVITDCEVVPSIFEVANFDQELEQITDCRSSANNLLEQLTSFENGIALRVSKLQKENILRSTNNVMADVKVKDEDLKKKNTMLKQRLTLSENAKSNLEKKVKQLRQENKILNEKADGVLEQSYKQLLQQQIAQKEEYESKISESLEKYRKLQQEYAEYKAKQNFIPEQIQFDQDHKTEQDVKLGKEVLKLRDAYGNVMSENSKLELENATMRKLLDGRTAQLSEVRLVQEAYEKLLEENNTLRMELDTVKYKRSKDREALLEALSKDKSDSKKIQDVRIEYEAKFEKMKEKMVQLCREEMNKETQKLRNENVILYKKNKRLNEIIMEHKMGMRSDRDTLDTGSHTSSELFFGLSEALQSTGIHSNQKSSDDLLHTGNFVTTRRPVDNRKCATLPKVNAANGIQEDKEFQRNTLKAVRPSLAQNLEMEDEEEDLFNNKYLVDLKSGRCFLPNEQENNVSRLSELKWRNSLCPPHLKSSYPAETQFNSPTQFKEEELKLGDLDDSMSTKLLPGEKPRKKDIGTTSYKRPGPPTPSKNGGRVSLQGGEIQPRDVLRECNDGPKTPKRNTPSRLKSLFKGRNLSTKDSSENQHGTPRSKRLSIFRKQK
uniref:Uncharacterized protein n=1 Tax=Photinus pyralis TaxID=7054 RepID=A0A1Y1KCN0_PHOPY